MKKPIRRIIYLLSSLILGVSCSNHEILRKPSSFSEYATWSDFLTKEVMTKNFISKNYPDSSYMNPNWRDAGFVAFDEKLPPPSKLHRLNVQCDKGDQIFPAHPSVLTKTYHAAMYTEYDSSVPINSYACKVPSPMKKFCVKGDGAHLILLSDTYFDSCGKMYRGYWLAAFLAGEDNMGTLMSKGRVINNRPGTSVYDKDYIAGSTYSLRVADFLFFTELFPNDPALISKLRREALSKDFYLAPDNTFQRR